MINNQFDEILTLLKAQRDELIGRLISFVAGDTILFLPKDSGCDEKIDLVNQILGSRFVGADGIDVLSENLLQEEKLKAYLNACSVEKQAFIYLAATELRSVLSAVLMAEKKVSLEDVFNLAFYEEISQQKKWGIMPEVEERHQVIKSQLKALERWFNERSIS